MRLNKAILWAAVIAVAFERPLANNVEGDERERLNKKEQA
jgi:hypothetical protein